MADKTVTVKSSGGNYTSLNAALAGESANLTSGSYYGGGPGRLNIVCYSMTDTTSAATGGGYTASSNYYINIYTDPSARHAGVWDSGKYNLSTATGSDSIYFYADYTHISYLQVSNSGTAVTDNCIERGGYRNYATIIGNICKGGYNGIICNNIGNGGDLIYNNIVYNCYRSGIYDSGVNGNLSYVLNNTVYNCNTGHVTYAYGLMDSGSGYLVAENNLISSTYNGGSCGDFYFTGSNITATYNISSDTTAVGTGCQASKSLANIAFNSTTPGSENLGIQSSSCAVGAGYNLSGTFTTDITGATRGSPWDIGAFMYAAAGGGFQPAVARGANSLIGGGVYV